MQDNKQYDILACLKDRYLPILEQEVKKLLK